MGNPNGATVINLVFKPRVRRNRGHYIKQCHPLSKHAVSEIVYTKMVHSLTSYRLKIQIVDNVALMFDCLNSFEVFFTLNLVDPVFVCVFLDLFMYMSTILKRLKTLRVYSNWTRQHQFEA